MTAVASTPIHTLPHIGWGSDESSQSGLSSMSAEELTRMVPARKAPQRSNSSSSLSSTSSNATSLSAGSISQKAAPKKAGWLSSRPDSAPQLPNGRAPISSGVRAASAMSTSMQQPSPIVPNQNSLQLNGPRQNGQNGEPQALLILSPMNGTFERKQIQVPVLPEFLRIGRQTNAKTVPTPHNGYFDSKVLSRQHAEIYADRNGKVWIRDVKSSNGTFVNGYRLSPENRESEPQELRENDMLELGIDIVSDDQKSIVHHKVSAKIEHAGIHTPATSVLDLNFNDLDPAASGNLMGQSFSQALPSRSRNGSQTPVTTLGRVSSSQNIAMMNSGAVAQRQMVAHFNSVSFEQIVKMLNTQSKKATEQTEHLKLTSSIFDNIKLREKRASKPALPADTAQPDQAARGFLSFDIPLPPLLQQQPPKPPPSQPLPQKPDLARSVSMDPSVLNGIVKPMAPSLSPTEKTDSQILGLLKELEKANTQLATQDSRMRELEALLNKERKARQEAEERVKSLSGQASESGASQGSSIFDSFEEDPKSPVAGNKTVIPPSAYSFEVHDVEAQSLEVDHGLVDDAKRETAAVNISTSRLQERLDLMVEEMTAMKLQMEKYRTRAESAEQEKGGLAELVRKLRDETSFEAPLISRSRSADGSTQTGLLANGAARGDETDVAAALGDSVHVNGKPVPPGKEIQELHKAISTALARQDHTSDRFGRSAPFASMIGVVLIGVGIMAYLNGLPRTDR